jgi:hypothetical protein
VFHLVNSLITGIISLAVGDYVTCNFNSDGAGTNIYLPQYTVLRTVLGI